MPQSPLEASLQQFLWESDRVNPQCKQMHWNALLLKEVTPEGPVTSRVLPLWRSNLSHYTLFIFVLCWICFDSYQCFSEMNPWSVPVYLFYFVTGYLILSFPVRFKACNRVGVCFMLSQGDRTIWSRKVNNSQNWMIRTQCKCVKLQSILW